jgi:hypothetical protein
MIAQHRTRGNAIDERPAREPCTDFKPSFIHPVFVV